MLIQPDTGPPSGTIIALPSAVRALSSPSLTDLPRLPAAERGIRRIVDATLNLLLLAAAYVLYQHISGVLPRPTGLAHAHAAAVIGLEQRLHLFVEPQLQRAALQSSALHAFTAGEGVRRLSTLLYGGGHLPWLAAVLFWLYLFRPPQFRRIRNIAVAATLLAIAVAAVYPVAPPRFALAGAPFWVQDVTGLQIPEGLYVRIAPYDPYAATPSVHTLWALLTGLGLWLGATRPLGRALAACFPLAIVATVIITGNHYIVDCLASLGLLIVCVLGQLAWERLRARHRQTSGVPYRGPDRRRAPNMRSLDYPLVFCACPGILLSLDQTPMLRLTGIALLAIGTVTLFAARIRARRGAPLHVRDPRQSGGADSCSWPVPPRSAPPAMLPG